MLMIRNQWRRYTFPWMDSLSVCVHSLLKRYAVGPQSIQLAVNSGFVMVHMCTLNQ